MVERSAELGTKLKGWLKELSTDSSYKITDVRGHGLFVGIDYDTEAQGIAGKVSQACLEEGMILLSTGARETSRFIPPLTISEEELRLGFDMYKSALEKASAWLGVR